MAVNLKNTLFPPQVETFMPAFPMTEDAIVYYSLSPFNENVGIYRIHVSVVNQINNDNALINPTGVFFSDLNYDTEMGLYYVRIPANEITDKWNNNQYYKVQLRFDSNETISGLDLNTIAGRNAYLNDAQYQLNFSEWSRICLIRPIATPIIELRKFNNGEQTTAFNKGLIPISGQLFFVDGGNIAVEETEKLQSFNLQVLEESHDEVLLQSKTYFTADQIAPNVINVYLDTQTLDTSATSRFRLRVNYRTNDQYVGQATFPFQIAELLENDTFNPTITAEVDNELGHVLIHLTNKEDSNISGTLHVRRTSSKDNYKSYETIYSKKVYGSMKMDLIDDSVASMVFYRYTVQLENSKGVLTPIYRSNKVMPEFYDAILIRDGRQLKIKYGYRISNFRPIVNRTKVDTLGGKYPKFAENAMMNYKQFSISGTLTAMMDEQEKFLNREEYFGDDYIGYLTANEMKTKGAGYRPETKENIYITEEAYNHNDQLWEREFREAAIAWLNDGEPKLYKSTPEGNLVVMLTDVSLTPNTTLSRRVWDFNATVYEVADGYDLESLDLLDICRIQKDSNEIFENFRGDINDNEYLSVERVGQLYYHNVVSSNTGTKNNIIQNIIEPEIQATYAGVSEAKQPINFSLKAVKIFFHSKPNVYLQDDNNNLILIDNPMSWPADSRASMQLGYVFDVTTEGGNSSTIFVNAQGYYQLPANLTITSLDFPHVGDQVTIEYVLCYKEKDNQSFVISENYVDNTIVGQQQGIFQPGEYLSESIRAKYNYIQTGEYTERMSYWKALSIDVTPFALLEVQWRDSGDINTLMVGDTGILNMFPDYPVQDMRFLGRRMSKIPKERLFAAEPWEYVLDKEENTYEKTDMIINPQRNMVYHVGEGLKIYYQERWYDFVEDDNMMQAPASYDYVPETGKGAVYQTGLAKVPVEGNINYLGDIIKSSF